jgi:hypothetical protein
MELAASSRRTGLSSDATIMGWTEWRALQLLGLRAGCAASRALHAARGVIVTCKSPLKRKGVRFGCGWTFLAFLAFLRGISFFNGGAFLLCEERGDTRGNQTIRHDAMHARAPDE